VLLHFSQDSAKIGVGLFWELLKILMGGVTIPKCNWWTFNPEGGGGGGTRRKDRFQGKGRAGCGRYQAHGVNGLTGRVIEEGGKVARLGQEDRYPYCNLCPPVQERYVSTQGKRKKKTGVGGVRIQHKHSNHTLHRSQ